MSQNDVQAFEWRVRHILDWSSLDPRTREVLEQLMAEVVALVKS